MKYLFSFISLLYAASPLAAQTASCPPKDCACIRQKADAALAADDFEAAIKYYQTWRICAPKVANLADSLVQMAFKKISEANKKQALSAYANDLAYKSLIALREGDRTTAFRLAEFAYRYVEQEHPNVIQALTEAIYYNDHPDTTHRLPWMEDFPGGGHIAFSPDGQRLAIGASIWDLETGKMAMRLPAYRWNTDCSIGFSPDGKLLASGSLDSMAIVWDLETRESLMRFSGHTSSILCVAFSPDGKRLASGSNDKTAKIWDLETGKELLIIQNYVPVGCIAFSPDGKHLASQFKDNTAKIWDSETGKETMTLQGHTQHVVSIAFSPDGKYVASGSVDQKVKIWDLGTGKEIMTLSGHNGYVLSVAFSPDGRYLTSGATDETARIWDLKSGQEIMILHSLNSSVRSVAFSSDGESLATSSDRVRIWDLKSDTKTLKLNDTDNYLNSIAFSPDRKFLASESGETTVKVWDLETGKETAALRGHTGYINHLAFSPDGKRLASSGSSDHTIKIWDLESNKETMTLNGHRFYTAGVAFSPDGKYLASGSGGGDRDAKIWDLRSGQEIMSFSGKIDDVPEVAFSPNGQYLAINLEYHTIKIWDLERGKEHLNLHSSKSFTDPVFSPDGKYLASVCGNNAIKIWDLAALEKTAETSPEPMTLRGHKSDVWNIAFSPDGQRLASSGRPDDLIKIWDLKSGKEMATLQGHNSDIKGLVFSLDGRYLISGSSDKTIKTWVLTPEDWWASPQGSGRRLAGLNLEQLTDYKLETLLDQRPDNEQKLIETGDIEQIKSFADLATAQANNSNVLANVSPSYARADRLYAAILTLQPTSPIKQEYAAMLRRWAAVYRSNGQADKAEKLRSRAEILWEDY